MEKPQGPGHAPPGCCKNQPCPGQNEGVVPADNLPPFKYASFSARDILTISREGKYLGVALPFLKKRE